MVEDSPCPPYVPSVQETLETRELSRPLVRSWNLLKSNKPRLLVLLLRFEAVIEMLAFLAMLMPRTWMAATHQWLGLGTFPASSLLDYMIRSVCLLYGLHGVLLWIAASDIKRYRPIVVYLTASYFAAALVFSVVDPLNGFPWSWTVWEVGSVVWLGLVLLFLVMD